MSAVLEVRHTYDEHAHTDAPLVVVGCGPVGCRVAEELARLCPHQSIVQYGAESVEPYNRVRLSSFLAGEIDFASLATTPGGEHASRIDRRLGCAVTGIDRTERVVLDAVGRRQPYSKLVLATGSSPHVPHIANLGLSGVYTFRDFNDAQQLFARRMRSRRTVVLGAGLLGLEAARAMRRFNTEVCVIEHATRALPRMLDEAAGALLVHHLAKLGIGVVLNATVRALEGDGRVSGVRLANGEFIDCDTVIVATGIRPSIDLARNAGLSVGRGIRVDDSLRTSDAEIFAVGECVEHREVVYGLVGPGIEQATVAAAVIAGQRAEYRGSTLATKLKVVGLPVFAVGKTVDDDYGRNADEILYKLDNGYRKIVVQRGRLIGAVAVNETPEMSRLQEAVTQRRRIWFWQRWRFARTGRIWPEVNIKVAQWPATAAVCQCTGVTRGQLTAAMSAGCSTVAALAARTGASTVCGSCRPLLAELTGGDVEPIRGAGWLWGTGAVAAVAALLFATLPAIPFNDSIASGPHWDVIWRDSFFKQVSGYTLLALSIIAAVLSFRKRIRKFTFGDFSSWRIVHGVVGALTIIGLLAHTGARLGANLDFYLMASFLVLIALGAASAGAIAFEHRITTAVARKRWVWAHIALTWPLPALLTWHVLKSYYF